MMSVVWSCLEGSPPVRESDAREASRGEESGNGGSGSSGGGGGGGGGGGASGRGRGRRPARGEENKMIATIIIFNWGKNGENRVGQRHGNDGMGRDGMGWGG